MPPIKILLLNGPPGSGKDTLAQLLQGALPNEVTQIHKFAQPLKDVARKLYCRGNYLVFDSLDSPGEKDLPNEVFFGKTCREVQIAISETFLKPLHGSDIFGKILVSELKSQQDYLAHHGVTDPLYVFVTDSGFKPEAEVVVKAFGAQNVKHVKLTRDGKDFSNDSRSYIDLTDLGVETIEVHNTENYHGKVAYDLLENLRRKGWYTPCQPKQ